MAVLSAAVAGGNAYFGWGLTLDQVLTIIGPLLAFIGVEGYADAVERKALANQASGDTTTTVVNK